MLIDEPATLLDLFIENLIRGTVTFNRQLIDKLDIKIQEQMVQDRADMMEWYRIRRIVPRPSNYPKLMNSLCETIIHWRTTGAIQGELKDVVSEERIKQLEKEKEDLISIVADQKDKLDKLYLESPDKKNIRGIS